jgi:acetyl-CoA synthetase
VAIYMPMVPEAAVAMLACARIGAAHSVVFGGFSAPALRERIEDGGCTAVITADGSWRRGLVQPLKARSTRRSEDSCPDVHSGVRGAARGERGGLERRRDVWWHDAVAPRLRRVRARAHGLARTSCSSSTPPARPASPRASCTPPAGYLTHGRHDQPLRLRPARGGRVLVHGRRGLGHRPQLRGLRAALCNGATRGHVRGGAELAALRTGSGRSSRATRRPIFYTAPTAIRAFMKLGDEPVKKHDLSSLRAPGHRRRADQPRGLDLVLGRRRRRPLPDRRHLVADRDGRPS